MISSAWKNIARAIATPSRSPPERVATIESGEISCEVKPIRRISASASRVFASESNQPERPGYLATHEQVAHDRLLLSQRLVLVDRLDAAAAGRGGVPVLDRVRP